MYPDHSGKYTRTCTKSGNLRGLALSSPTVAFKIGIVQMRCTDDARENQAAAEDRIRAAAKKGAKIVCLPELYRSLYFCQTEDHANFALAEPIPGPSTKALGALAKKLKIAIVGSLFEE